MRTSRAASRGAASEGRGCARTAPTPAGRQRCFPTLPPTACSTRRGSRCHRVLAELPAAIVGGRPRPAAAALGVDSMSPGPSAVDGESSVTGLGGRLHAPTDAALQKRAMFLGPAHRLGENPRLLAPCSRRHGGWGWLCCAPRSVGASGGDWRTVRTWRASGVEAAGQAAGAAPCAPTEEEPSRSISTSAAASRAVEDRFAS